MTNSEKYKEIFGFEPDDRTAPYKCPDDGCLTCSKTIDECMQASYEWWHQEYEEPNQKKE